MGLSHGLQHGGRPAVCSADAENAHPWVGSFVSAGFTFASKEPVARWPLTGLGPEVGGLGRLRAGWCAAPHLPSDVVEHTRRRLSYRDLETSRSPSPLACRRNH